MEQSIDRAGVGLILDPRTKLLLLILVNVLLYSFGPSVYLYAATGFAALLIVLAGVYRPLLYMIGMYAVLFFVNRLMGFAPEGILQTWSALSLPLFLFLPLFMYAILFFTTTTIGDAAAAFHKMRLPNVLLIPLLVMFRFFPTIGQEFRAITNAMKLRSAIGRGNPLRTVEYVYVPLLFSLVKTGEELTLASLTRGLGLHKDRTYIQDPKLRWFDYGALVVMIFLIVARRWGPTI
ncbi:MAG: energy-coupling factor transporter transmembrane component T [Bacteroidota bacterium]